MVSVDFFIYFILFILLVAVLLAVFMFLEKGLIIIL